MISQKSGDANVGTSSTCPDRKGMPPRTSMLLYVTYPPMSRSGGVGLFHSYPYHKSCIDDCVNKKHNDYILYFITYLSTDLRQKIYQ